MTLREVDAMRISIGLLLLALLAVPGLAADDPVSVVEKYYVHLNDRNLQAAWQLKSSDARRESTFDAFRKNWETCESVGFYEGPEVLSNDGRKAVVAYRLGSVDRTTKYGLRYGQYSLRTTLVKESGRWWLDRFEVSEEDVSVAPRWDRDRPDLPVPQVPGDVPVYRGFQMAPAVAVEALPDGDLTYTRRSRRVPGVAPRDVAEWYVREIAPPRLETHAGDGRRRIRHVGSASAREAGTCPWASPARPGGGPTPPSIRAGRCWSSASGAESTERLRAGGCLERPPDGTSEVQRRPVVTISRWPSHTRCG